MDSFFLGLSRQEVLDILLFIWVPCLSFSALMLILHLIAILFGKSDKARREIAEDVLNWCLWMYPVKKSRPQLVLEVIASERCGGYEFSTNTIWICTKKNRKTREIVSTLIHEYFHYYLVTSQSKYDLYSRQLEEFGYKKHPQEMLCDAMADKLTKRYLEERG